MEWNNNNLACLKTWANLMLLKQHDEVFKKAGKMKMKRFLFWNQTASAEIREIMAKTICLQLDGMFVQLDNAKYEKGFSAEKAVNEIFAALKEGEKTMCDLAEVADKCYNFSEY
jgi:hypothetical protein